MGKAAFVTGATGFLGTNLVKELVAQDWQVHIIHRNSSNLKYISTLNVEKKIGSIEDIDALLNSIPQNIDAIFHVAANTSFWSRFNQEQYRTNVIGTQNVIKAAQIRNVGRLIHTSSLSVYGFHSKRINEKTPSNALDSGINYFITKYLAEQEIKKAISKGLDAVILNPAHIVGPYDTHNWVQIFNNVNRGKMPGIPNTLGTFTYAPEVAKAHIKAFEKGKKGESYLLGGVEASMLQFVNTIESLLGKSISTKTTSLWVLKLATMAYQLGAIINDKEPILTPEKTKLLSHNVLCDDSKAQAELDFIITPLEEIVAATFQWLKQEKML